MRRAGWICGAVLAALLASAAQAQALFNPEPFNAFEPGKTRRADVTRALGEPVQEMPGRDRDTVVFYEYRTVDPAKPLLTAVLVFGPDKVLKIVRFYSKTD